MFDGSILPAGVDVIVRLHDIKRLLEFSYALFSLCNQSYSPVHVIVVTQSFDTGMTAEALACINTFGWREQGHPEPSVINVRAAAGVDVRAKLLNVGIERARFRFLAFLDADDYVYGHAYAYLAAEAKTSGAALTFGGIVCRHIKVFDQFVYSVNEFRDSFPGDGVRDMLRRNFCPIHSFLVDREQVDPGDLRFNPSLDRLEDYDFLLRLCTKYPTHFDSRAKVVGVYNWHLDGRGSIQFGQADAAKAEKNRRAWNNARRHIWRLKTLLGGDLLSAEGAVASGSADLPLLVPAARVDSAVMEPAQPEKRSVADCIEFNPDGQLALLGRLQPYASGVGQRNTELDTWFLLAALGCFRPRSMIQVGGGSLALVVAAANRAVVDHALDFTCIDPDSVRSCIDGVSDPGLFDTLRAGDFLFVGSADAGGELDYLVFDVLPRLKPGVIVHLPGVFLPDEHPSQTSPNAQSLIRAFLQYNSRFKVIWAAHFMVTRHAASVEAVFPGGVASGGGNSLWLMKA